MTLIFKNKFGKISLCGKSSCTYAIKSVSGLGVCNKNYDCITYYGSDGKTTLSSSVSSRVITISFDIINFNRLLVKKATRVLFCDGILTVINDSVKRKINYKPLSLEMGERHGNIQSAVVQIECDNPFFEDIFPKSADLYSKTKNITSPFTLPAIFSTRLNEAVIVNSGDVKTYPIITVSPLVSQQTDFTFSLLNKTTGNTISFSLTVNPGEIITIDTENRQATSSVKGNIAQFITDGALGNMYIDSGPNNLKLEFSDTSLSVKSGITYTLKYMEAL